MAAVELADVQGLILRGYTMPVARHLGLTVRESRAARAFLAALTNGDPAVPSITTAQPWAVKPDCCINLGLTFSGLVALGVPPESLASFPAEYAEGAAARAARVGDIGASAPAHWLPWLADPGLHLLLSLFAQSSDALESTTRRLEQAWSPGCLELGRHEGKWLPANVAHFGYRDGLSQPTMDGVPLAGLPDHLPGAALGEFLFGHQSQHDGFTYPVPAPPELGTNGSFAAFRVLAQDVDAFAEFLAQQASRWRNSVPLVLSPDTDTPGPDDPPPPKR